MKKYKKIEYKILLHPHMGFPLAYIKLPQDFKIPRDEYKSVDIACHGGVTFEQVVTKKNKEEFWQKFDEGLWIGWDYGHAGDWIGGNYGIGLPDEKHWQPEEVEAEVKKVIDQLSLN